MRVFFGKMRLRNTLLRYCSVEFLTLRTQNACFLWTSTCCHSYWVWPRHSSTASVAASTYLIAHCNCRFHTIEHLEVGSINKNTLMIRKTIVFLFYCFSFFYCLLLCGRDAAAQPLCVWLSRINESLLLCWALSSAADKGHCVAASLPIPVGAEDMPRTVYDVLPCVLLLPSSGTHSVQWTSWK